LEIGRKPHQQRRRSGMRGSMGKPQLAWKALARTPLFHAQSEMAKKVSHWTVYHSPATAPKTSKALRIG
jgi:hypothetical protein